MEASSSQKTWLESVLEDMDCVTGTLHRADEESCLELVVAIGVPDSLMSAICRIPFGKGIAGAAAQSKRPVELCNLQQDLGGVAKEAARATMVSGALAVPVFSICGRDVVGTLGVGKREPYRFTEQEKDRLAAWADEARGLIGEA